MSPSPAFVGGDTRAPPINAIRRIPRVHHVSPKSVAWTTRADARALPTRSANSISSHARFEEAAICSQTRIYFLSTGGIQGGSLPPIRQIDREHPIRTGITHSRRLRHIDHTFRHGYGGCPSVRQTTSRE